MRLVIINGMLVVSALLLVFAAIVGHCGSCSSSNSINNGGGGRYSFFASAFAPPPSHVHSHVHSHSQSSPSFLSRLELKAAASSKPPNRISATTTTTTTTTTITTTTTATTNKSSVGRLRFCYDRLKKECPEDDYLRKTPSLVIAADLQNSLSSERGNERTLPEEMCIAVLDAYMVAYRDARKNQNQSRGDTDVGIDIDIDVDTQQLRQKQEQQYSERMDAVVNGMLSTISIMNKHDEHNNNKSCDDENKNSRNNNSEARTVDPYATILHMLLELTLDDDGRRSSHWAAKSLEVLSSLESNPLLTSTSQHSKTRVVQYNKVLKGLVTASCSYSTTRVAVKLLDSMCECDIVVENSEDDDYNVNVNVNENFKVTKAMENLTIGGPAIVPDAKSFATVLGSSFLEKDDAKRLVGASVSFGVYEGYLEKFLKRTFGDQQLAEFLGE
jgi:hypothetical protein